MEYQKKQRIYKTIMLIILVMVITFLATTVGMYKYMGGEKVVYVSGKTDSIASALASFRKIIDQKFLGEVKEEELLQGAIKGYIDGLDDPYTEYITKEEMADYTADIMGNFVGIGIYLAKDTQTNAIIVISPIKDTPAHKAGILPGDYITKVDGVSYSGDQVTEASNKIKGEEGTKVKIEIVREGETKEFEIIRENIKVNHVEAEILENKIGYLKLNTFDEGCSTEFEQKFDELNQKGVTSLIVDLRNNGGGIVDEALKIADLMIQKDATLLITTDKNGKEKISKSKQEPKINMPIVVLTNENSASASEILVGALKDNQKATIVGTKTYGKGVIQEFLTLSDGSGLKITTNEYYTPNHNKINEIGIAPDEEVKETEEAKKQLQVEKEKDTQLIRAIEIIKTK